MIWLKRLRCKHHWEMLYGGAEFYYGCHSCGKFKVIKSRKKRIWEFKEKHKERTFER